jgi:hypothetical protein
MFNLERNALVSVFLRVLEYYDGIFTSSDKINVSLTDVKAS